MQPLPYTEQPARVVFYVLIVVFVGLELSIRIAAGSPRRAPPPSA